MAVSMPADQKRNRHLNFLSFVSSLCYCHINNDGFLSVAIPMSRDRTPAQRVLTMAAMLFFGTCTVVVQKFLFGQRANGRTDKGYANPHDFRKPWFQTSSMFVGMTLALIVYETQRFIKYRERQNALASADQPPASGSHCKFYVYVGAPALFDLVATALSHIGLLFIEASVWQMLRGSMVLFSLVFCSFILKRPHFPYMWYSVLVIVIALAIVGVSSVAATGIGKAGVTSGEIALAIIVTIAAQVVQAGQIVVEEFLLHDMVAAPTFIVGLEGLWGTVLTWAIFIPAVSVIPGQEGGGIHEDIKDTFVMMKNSGMIVAFVVIYVFVILFYNVTGMMVTQQSSAVVRTILEALRTLCIWVVEIALHYGLANTQFGWTHPDLGEELTPWSVLEFAGFMLFVTGMLVYNRVIELPIFRYPPPKPVEPEGDPLISQGLD
jgi:hypothetical protein